MRLRGPGMPLLGVSHHCSRGRTDEYAPWNGP